MTNKHKRCSVLHVSYYPSLLQTRQAMMEAEGLRVTSVLGNDECKALATAQEFDIAVVGFSSRTENRRDITRWLKRWRPHLPVIALITQSEQIPHADRSLSAEDPAVWLAAVRDLCPPRP